MTFQESCDKLGIGEYADRIFHSSSTGELFHIEDYFIILSHAEKNEAFAEEFPSWFKSVVLWAEENWKRPESIFQHILRLLNESSKK